MTEQEKETGARRKNDKASANQNQTVRKNDNKSPRRNREQKDDRRKLTESEISSDNNVYQVTMLEGREKCEMKLTKPLKFKTGRRDCKTEEDRKFVTKDHEVGITILKDSQVKV